MNKTLTIFLSKIILKLLKLIGRGSSLPGEIALKLNKNLLKEFKINSKIIAVTGSSGKGSTSSMIVDSLRELGYSVAHNMKGSNLKFGIITLLIENSNIHGELNQDFLVFEMDERYAKYVFCDIEPDFVIVTNVTRDQPPRQGNVDIVLNDIKNAIPKKSHIILNADSPYMQNLVIDKENEVTYYSVCENKFSENESIYKKLNIYYCPKCSCKLKYSYYNFEENGKYICTNEKCGFEYPRPDFEVTDINFECNIITINNEYNVAGALSELIKAFVVKASGVSEVSAYADLRYDDLNQFNQTVLSFVRNTDPYGYLFKTIAGGRVKDLTLTPLSYYTPVTAEEELYNYDRKLTVVENFYEHDYRTIYDCGRAVYKYTVDKQV